MRGETSFSPHVSLPKVFFQWLVLMIMKMRLHRKSGSNDFKIVLWGVRTDSLTWLVLLKIQNKNKDKESSRKRNIKLILKCVLCTPYQWLSNLEIFISFNKKRLFQQLFNDNQMCHFWDNDKLLQQQQQPVNGGSTYNPQNQKKTFIKWKHLNNIPNVVVIWHQN